MMQVLILLDTFPSLSETFLYTTIQNLQEADIEISLLARKRGKTFHTLPFRKKVIYLPSESFPFFLKVLLLFFLAFRLFFQPSKYQEIIRLLQQGNNFRHKLQLAYRSFPLFLYQNEIVYFPFGGLAVKYLEYVKATSAQVTFSLRGSDIHIDPLQVPYRGRLQEALEAASGIHCVCREIEEKALALAPNIDGKTAVIYTALASSFDKNVVVNERAVIKLISVGRLDWRKGFEHGIVATRDLAERGIDFHWTIIGEGEYRIALAWAIRDMGLSEHVTLAGAMKHDDVADALQDADIFFHPSIHEGISNAVLEAMALGLPVVACEVGGMSEAIASGENGFLVPPRNWKSMSEALEKLARSSELRAQIGAVASASVRSQFSTEKQVEGFLAFFQDAVKCA